MERRLAAVLIADVVGYGRLSQADEEGTRARFQAALKQVFEPKIAAHYGRLVKTMGDGVLVEFGSVVNALRCAVDIQRAEAEANAALPLGQRIEFRIAINLGDVIVEGEDIHGTGVNIADRLQALARPGGVVISGTAYDQVTNKLDVGYEFLGEQRVKNISEPVRVYGVLTGLTAVRPPAGAMASARRQSRWRWGAVAAAILLLLLLGAGAMLWLRPWAAAPQPTAAEASLPSETKPPTAADAKPSLAVLPFDSLSDDKEQAYLADGITEDLTTELARIPGLFVISRNATFTYKGKATQPAEIGKALGVRYILEGSIRRAGDDMRINAQLIDGQSGGHLWAERFDGAWADVFKLQDQVVDKVASALSLELVAGPRLAKAPGATAVPAAYDLYLRAYGLNYGNAPAEVSSLLKQAVALDPNFGQAWAELAWLYWTSTGVDEAQRALGLTYAETVAKTKESVKEAEKHPSSSYYQLVADLLVYQRQSDEAISAAERAIALDPSDYYSYEEMSFALVFKGRAADAKKYLDAANRVDPRWHPWRHFLAGLVAFAMGGFEDAVASLGKADPADLNMNGKFQRLLLLAAAHAHLDHAKEAGAVKAEIEALAKAKGEKASAYRAIGYLPFKLAADAERLWSGLTQAGLPDFPFGFQPKDRLTGEEIRSLVFGHELRGTQITTNEPYIRTTTAEGLAHVSTGTSFSSAGVSRIEGDFLCTLFETDIDITCAVLFRNPGGTPEKQNEYAWVVPNNHLTFSQVK